MSNPFIANKILTYYNEAKLIQQGKFPIPRMALIYPSYACNHHCLGCHYKDWDMYNGEWEKDPTIKSPFIDVQLYYNLLKEFKEMGLEAIEFCGGGEPTVHPQFERLLEIIREFGFKFGMFTNGDAIDRNRGIEMLKTASYVRISIDNEIKWENIRMLADIKKEIGSKCYVGTKILVNSLNEKRFGSLIEKCHENGADYIHVKAEKPTKHPVSVEAQAVVDHYRKHFGNVYGNTHHTELTCKCWLSPIHTMVDAYGDVYLCCYYNFREDSHKVGNAFKAGFKNIWGSERHKEVIQGINKKECDVFDCRWHTYNKVMLEMMEGSHLEFC